jgi:hypothetical protein
VDGTAPFTWSLDAGSLVGGSHTLEGRAYDGDGNAASSSPVTVHVGVAAVPPVVSLAAPLDGARVAGAVLVWAAASDDVGVARVEFLVDGQVVDVDGTAPFESLLETGSLAEGTHTLQARAHDAAGNVSTSAPVVVDVARGG